MYPYASSFKLATRKTVSHLKNMNANQHQGFLLYFSAVFVRKLDKFVHVSFLLFPKVAQSSCFFSAAVLTNDSAGCKCTLPSRSCFCPLHQTCS